jgi:hypothetical protein
MASGFALIGLRHNDPPWRIEDIFEGWDGNLTWAGGTVTVVNDVEPFGSIVLLLTLAFFLASGFPRRASQNWGWRQNSKTLLRIRRRLIYYHRSHGGRYSDAVYMKMNNLFVMHRIMMMNGNDLAIARGFFVA